MAKTSYIELPTSEALPILYEDRSVLAVDKPPGWMLAPDSWHKTGRNLQAVLAAGIAARAFWATSRNLRFLRFVHRLDAETSGVLLLAKNKGAVSAYSRLFESRKMEKHYLAVVKGAPAQNEWSCQLRLREMPDAHGRIRVDTKNGNEAETRFRLLEQGRGISLVEAKPITGRTHQIRVHLAEIGHPVVGDKLYGEESGTRGLGLRAVFLSYVDPFSRILVKIQAPTKVFLRLFEFGFQPQ